MARASLVRSLLACLQARVSFKPERVFNVIAHVRDWEHAGSARAQCDMWVNQHQCWDPLAQRWRKSSLNQDMLRPRSHRPSGRAVEPLQCRTRNGPAAKRASARVPSHTPSGASSRRRIPRRTTCTNQTGEVWTSTVRCWRSGRQVPLTACWRSCYAATLRRCLLSSMVSVPVHHATNPLQEKWQPPVSSGDFPRNR